MTAMPDYLFKSSMLSEACSGKTAVSRATGCRLREGAAVNVTLFGGIGRLVVTDLLAGGHDVKAYVRDEPTLKARMLPKMAGLLFPNTP